MPPRSLTALPLAFALTLSACGSSDSGPPPGDTPPADVEGHVAWWLSHMTLEEKCDQMHGSSIVAIDGLYLTPGNDRLGIPGYAMSDGPRGVRIGHATTFPVGMARAATWQPDLEEKVGEAMGLELAAKGGNVLLSPTVNNLRHPQWGRAQETYGEDVFLLGAMGSAAVTGIQKHVLASVKHFAANSIEDTRQTVDVTIDERTLREIYLRQFETIVTDAHPASVMSAYNSVNGHHCSENAHLLHDILDGEWGFDGFVESDWLLGTHSTAPAANAGLDIEMPLGAYFATDKLVAAVTSGEIPESVIDDAVRRILRKKLEFHLDAPEKPPSDVVESKTHTDLALDVEREAIVLLKNDNATLPLDPSKLHSVAVVGELADAWNLGDKGSSNAVPSWAVTPFAGLADRLGAGVALTKVPGPIAPSDEAAIQSANCAIVVVGLTAKDEGENLEGIGGGGDRDSLDLSVEHQALITKTASLNPRTIVVVEAGSAIAVANWIDQVPALLMAWYPGQEGGHALADVLLGSVNPSGKLPVTFAVSDAQLPPFVHEKDAVTYDYFHGYRYLDHDGDTPSFPFGFGLSYTTFSYANLRLSESSIAPDGTLEASVDVTNTGAREGKETVELYVSYEGSKVERAVRDLEGFSKVDLQPGETKTVTLALPASRLAYWDVAKSAWVVEPIHYTVAVGGSSRDLPVSAGFDVGM